MSKKTNRNLVRDIESGHDDLFLFLNRSLLADPISCEEQVAPWRPNDKNLDYYIFVSLQIVILQWNNT